MEMGKLYGYTMNGISLIETMKASGLENDFFQSWAGEQAKVVLQNQKMARISFIVDEPHFGHTGELSFSYPQ